MQSCCPSSSCDTTTFGAIARAPDACGGFLSLCDRKTDALELNQIRANSHIGACITRCQSRLYIDLKEKSRATLLTSYFLL